VARARPEVEGVTGETEAAVWAEVKVSVRTAEYESATVTLGQSVRMDPDPEARRKARRTLLRECEREVVSKALAVKEAWKDQT